MKSKSWQLSRRHMLRGASATIALPFLEAMLPSPVVAAGSKGRDGLPVRFAAFFMPDGVNHRQFTPKGRTLSELPPILRPLAGLNEYVNIITGINNADNGHAAGTSAFLTGQSPKKTGKASEVNVRNASIDQIIGNAFKSSTALPTLELGLHTPKSGVSMSGHSKIYLSFVSWRNASTPVPHEINPQRAFDRLFKNARVSGSGKRKAPAQAPSHIDRSVLDAVLDDAKGLRQRLGRADQQKLDEYLTAVREVEQRIDNQTTTDAGLRISQNVYDQIQSVGGKISKAMGDRKKGGIKAIPDLPYQEHGQLMMDVMALAFWSNSTRASTLMFGDGLNGRNMSFLPGVNGNHHSISHHGNKPKGLATFSKVNTYFVGQYAYFLNRLKNMAEGGSNVLENSVVLLGSNISSGQNHKGQNIPVIVSGKAGGRLRGNRHLTAKGEPIGKLHRSILELMNVEANIGAGKGTLAGI